MADNKLVLYLDDDLDDILLLQDAFREVKHYHLVSVQNDGDLRQILHSHKETICLVVLDINMPERSGIEILIELKTAQPYRHIPVVMLSTARREQDNEIIKGLGCEIVLKPSSYTEMITLASKLLQYCKEPSS